MHDVKRRLTAEEYEPLTKSEAALKEFAASAGVFPPLRIEGPDRNGLMVLWGKNAPEKKAAKPATKAQTEAAAKAAHNLSILDNNVKTILAVIDGLTADHLKALLAAERAGKTRKTVVQALKHALSTD
jgi:hypothetical protein